MNAKLDKQSPGLWDATDARLMLGLLRVLAVGSFLLFFHNYGFNILPYKSFVLRADQIQPPAEAKSFAYTYRFDHSEPDYPLNPHSRVRLFENGHLYRKMVSSPAEVPLVGGDRFLHEPGRITFASTDNTDPRKNGRTYELHSPILYHHKVGRLAALVFAAAMAGLYGLNRQREAASPELPPQPSRWRWHALGAGLLFVAGLYLNTGTLAPYGNNGLPYVDPATGYLYCPDHAHFRVLFDFVDGKERAVWDRALFLRRILFPVLAWPLMKLAGFETGGILTSLVLHTAAFAVCLYYFRRKIGDRGAIFAAWLLALSPGATYWFGMPYPYALIFPSSLLLMLGLLELTTPNRWGVIAAVSLGMGVAYLGYDLLPCFLPATLLALAWQRRFGHATLSVGLQALPMALWLLFLTYGLKQPLENSNSITYRFALSSYLGIKSLAQWWSQLHGVIDTGFYVYFGANFIFLPALFLIAVALNPLTSRIQLLPSEIALLLVGLGLFLFNNLAPAYGATWNMHGSWIARIYQPVFPAFIVFAARWWQHLPPLELRLRRFVWGTLALVFLGNALIVFGPILNNPFKVSEFAFSRFYYGSDTIQFIYEHHLARYGRRPLGFPKPQP